MKLRIILTIIVWILGTSTIAWDGQVFRNSLQMLAFCVLTLGIWVPLAVNKRAASSRRWVAGIISVVVLALAVMISIELPADYDRQNAWNDELRDHRPSN